jgi:glyoxylase-like metal-dependent hydrolase (beta-lactamase superfamily II)
MGNQVFAAKASIIATMVTQDAMNARLADMRELKRDPSELALYIQEIETLLQHESDARWRAHLSWTVEIEHHHLENLRTFKPTLPDQAFEGRVTFHGTKRRVDLYTPGAGHSGSDAILELPDDSIAFIGDLGFFQTHPYLGDSNPDKWMTTLEKLAAAGFATYVPGHGHLGTAQDLLQLKEYLSALQELVAILVEFPAESVDLDHQPAPAFSQDWAGFGRFERSIRYLYSRMRQARVENPDQS